MQPSIIYAQVTPTVLLVGGLMLCFAGYKYYKVATGGLGLLFGILIGNHLSPVVFAHDTVLSFVCAIVIGIVVGIAALSVHRIGVGVVAFTLGYMACAVTTSYLFTNVDTLLCAGCGLALAVFGMIFCEVISSVGTAFIGSAAIVASGAVFTYRVHEITEILADPGAKIVAGESGLLFIVSWVALGTAGVLTQYLITRHAADKALPNSRPLKAGIISQNNLF